MSDVRYDHHAIEKHWQVNGVHYSKTAEAWLQNLDRQKSRVMPVLFDVYGPQAASIWFQRWRIFFMACAELWGFRNGSEWLVSHYLLQKKSSENRPAADPVDSAVWQTAPVRLRCNVP